MEGKQSRTHVALFILRYGEEAFSVAAGTGLCSQRALVVLVSRAGLSWSDTLSVRPSGATHFKTNTITQTPPDNRFVVHSLLCFPV